MSRGFFCKKYPRPFQLSSPGDELKLDIIRGLSMLKGLLTLLILMAITISSAQADYHVTAYKSETIDVNKPTRLLLAGNGDDLGLLFQEVAKAKAMKYKELNSEEQIIFIAIKEKDYDSESSLIRYGFKVIRNERASLDGKEFISVALAFKKILSLDIFSHSSAQFGIHLDGRENRLNTKTQGLEKLKSNFTKDAFVYLHGCNSGFNLAPYMANIWGVPVAGSMTSTNFQKLHSDGNFYLSEEGFAPNTDWALTNTLSYDSESSCTKGACQRLKPDNTPYVGFWGAYRQGGLPFYKFFCPKNSTETCLKAMANSLVSHTLTVNLKRDSSLADYKKAVVDFLCPVSSKRDLRGECTTKLEEALVTLDYTYNPFSRPQVECDFNNCKVEITCGKVLFTGLPKPGTCELKNNYQGKATTLVREYKAYLDAYIYLKI